jgi:2-methylcitrate dehydratase PrpD
VKTSLAEKFATFVEELEYHKIPPETVELTKYIILKCVAGMVAGSTTSSGKRLVRYIKSIPSPEEVGVIASYFKTSVENAALANGFFAHASELEDDLLRIGVASTITTIPAVLPLAEKLKSSGKEVIEATLIGIEISYRLASAGYPRSDEMGYIFGWHTGAVGAAAAAAKLLGLDKERIKNAMGLALCQASGYYFQIPSDGHYFDTAFACRNGITAAMLAKEGFTSNPAFERWLTDLFGKERVNLDALVEGLGKPPFWIHKTWVKKYAACFLIHRHIDAYLLLMKEHKIKPEDVKVIEVHTGEYDAKLCDRPDPKSRVDGQFSYQHQLAVAAIDGDVGWDALEPHKLYDPKYVEFRKKVKVIPHPEWGPGIQVGVAKVVVRTKDGKVYEKEMEEVIGGPKIPLTKEQWLELYRKFAGVVLTKEEVEYTANKMLNLEKEPDITDLMNVLTFGFALRGRK